MVRRMIMFSIRSISAALLMVAAGLSPAYGQESLVQLIGHHCRCNSNCDCPSCADSPAADDQRADIDLSEQSLAMGGSSFAAMDVIGGYIDPAPIHSRFRLRYDTLKNADFPNRAGYMYPGPNTVGGPGPAFGSVGSELDLDELRGYLELAWCDQFSVFAEVPVRWVHGLGFGDPGVGDINAGLRYGLIADDDRFLTAQVRAYAQTGDPAEGLGAGHSSIEAGLLFQNRLSSRATVFGEILDWQAVNGFRVVDTQQNVANVADFVGQQFNGNVLRYGVGLGYDVWQAADPCSCSRITGVFEIVGWSVLDGLTTNAFGDAIFDASGDTIVNGKYGVRYTTPSGRTQLYAGYGNAWTEDQWYNSIFRIELLYNF